MTGHKQSYVHGTEAREQNRLAELNRLSNRAFLEFLKLEPSSVVLEVGSGLGLLTNAVSECVYPGLVVGLERSGDQRAQARARHDNLAFVPGDALKLPFRDEQFDVVYSRYVLEHLSDPLTAVKEMKRVLRPGGRAFAQENDISLCRVDPPSPAFSRVWNRFIELQASLGGDARIGSRLFRLFRQAGFSDVVLSSQPEIHWFGIPTFEPWIDNLIGNLLGIKDALQKQGLCSAEDTEEALADLERLKTTSDASSIFHWNRVLAIKE